MDEFERIFDEVIDLVDAGNFSQANLVMSNFYHKAERTLIDYNNIVTLTRAHARYKGASERTKGQIALILYMLDKRFTGHSDAVQVFKTDGEHYRIEELEGVSTS